MTIVMPEQKQTRRFRRRRWIAPGLVLVAIVLVLLYVVRRDEAHDTLVRQSVVRVEIVTQGGNVRIATTPNQGVVLSYRDRFAFFAPEITEKFEGSTLKVKIHCGWRPACSSDVTLTASTDVDVNVIATDGTIKAEGRAGSLTLLTHGGSIDVAATRGALTVKSGSGPVTLTGAQGSVSVNTNQGTVQASSLTSSTVEVATGTGAIDLGFATKPTKLSATSLNGGIVVGVPQGGYKLDVSTPSTVTVRDDSSSSSSITARTQGQVTVTAR